MYTRTFFIEYGPRKDEILCGIYRHSSHTEYIFNLLNPKSTFYEFNSWAYTHTIRILLVVALGELADWPITKCLLEPQLSFFYGTSPLQLNTLKHMQPTYE